MSNFSAIFQQANPKVTLQSRPLNGNPSSIRSEHQTSYSDLHEECGDLLLAPYRSGKRGADTHVELNNEQEKMMQWAVTDAVVEILTAQSLDLFVMLHANYIDKNENRQH